MKLPFVLTKVKSLNSLKLLYFVLFIFFTAFTNHTSASEAAIPLSAWLVRWHLDRPEKVEKICRELNTYPLNILTQVRGRADAYYTSNLVPRAEELSETAKTFDPLSLIIEKCSNQSIHAWLNVYYLWTGKQQPQNPSHPAQFSFPWILNDNNGRRVSDYNEIEQKQHWIEGIYADPASESYRKLFVSVVKELVNAYEIDGIHLDFIRYPGAQFGHGGELAHRFEQKWGFDPRLLPEKITTQDLEKWLRGDMNQADEILTSGALLWANMRAEEITKLIRDVRQLLDKKGKNIQLSTAIFPDYLPAYLEKGQDWLTWAEDGLVDRLYPMAYFGEISRIKKQIQKVVTLVGSSASVHAGLGAYIKTDTQISNEVKELSSLPINGISLFSLGHILQKSKGVERYFQAAGQFKNFTEKKSIETFGKNELVNVIRSLKKINFNGRGETPTAGRVQAKMSRFVESCKKIIPFSIMSLQNNQLTTPLWLEMQGVFRYVHPYDSEERKKQQEALCHEARQRLEKNISMEKVSQQFSQASSRDFQSVLPRYYLTEDKARDIVLAELNVSDISPVMLEPEEGFWCYRVTQRGEKEIKKFSEMPWPARRIIFREKLQDVLSGVSSK